MDAVEGINESDLDELCMQILDYADDASEIFQKIDLAIEPLPEYYKSDSCDEIMRRYQEFRKSYSIIKGNIASYSDELIALKRKMAEDGSYLTKLFTSYTEIAQNDLKKLL